MKCLLYRRHLVLWLVDFVFCFVSFSSVFLFAWFLVVLGNSNKFSYFYWNTPTWALNSDSLSLKSINIRDRPVNTSSGVTSLGEWFTCQVQSLCCPQTMTMWPSPWSMINLPGSRFFQKADAIPPRSYQLPTPWPEVEFHAYLLSLFWDLVWLELA